MSRRPSVLWPGEEKKSLGNATFEGYVKDVIFYKEKEKHLFSFLVGKEYILLDLFEEEKQIYDQRLRY